MTREVTALAMSRVEGFGLRSGCWQAAEIEETSDRLRFRILRDGAEFARVAVPLPGLYTVRNVLAATAAAAEQGLAPEEITAGLASFRGVCRRLEVRGEVGGVTVVDDFAHHPTAIVETLRAVRRRWPGRRVAAVLEPRSWSLRRNVFQERLARCFDDATWVIVAEVFRAEDVPEEERLDPERLAREISEGGGAHARYIPRSDEIVPHLVDILDRGDVVVVMSNGAFGGLHAKLLKALTAREGS